MKRGLVIGRFYPFHKGHQYVIDTAIANCDQLTVIVEGRKGQIIPGTVRVGWVRKIYPQLKVKLIYHNLASEDDQGWAKSTLKWLGYKPDLVFTSEHYGDNYAKLMGAKHVAVDIPRRKFPISGTEIRKEPQLYPQFLHPIVYKDILKKLKHNKIDEKIL